MFTTPIARIATRPGSGDISDFIGEVDVTPDLIMGTLMHGGAHLLKSNYIYEMVMNELTGIIEMREVGPSIIGKKWAHAYYDIPSQFGNEIWLSQDETKELEMSKHE